MKAKTRHRNLATALAFLAPNFLGFLLFVAFPVFFSVMLFVTNWSLKPAIDTRFVGLDNVWRLLGFKPIEDADPSGGFGWLAAFIGSYLLLAAGIIHSLVSIGRKHDGLRLGGWIGIAGSGSLLLLSMFSGIGVGAALIAITLFFAFFFFILSDDSDFVGRGAMGPIFVVVAIGLVYILRGPTLARWQPLDANFYYYLYNTLYMMVAIPIGIAGSLILAVILSEPLLKTRSRNRMLLACGLVTVGVAGFLFFYLTDAADLGVLWVVFWAIAALGIGGGVYAFRTLFYIPTFTAGIAVMLLWKQVFNPAFGPLNEGLRLIFEFPPVAWMFGQFGWQPDPPRWLGDPNWAKPAIMLMGFWTVVGGQNMLLYLAGLSNIPQDLYEAASIDGASKTQTFWNVTWPQLAPTTFFIVIMSTIAGLQGGFEQARVLTQGGPAGSTKTLAYYVYEKAFEQLELGYASAIAWVLFVIVFALTALNWRFGNRYVNY